MRRRNSSQIKAKGFLRLSIWAQKSHWLCDLCKSHGVWRSHGHKSSKWPMFAKLPGHDHHIRAEGKRALGTGFNASHPVTHALSHLSVYPSLGWPWTCSALSRHCESEPGALIGKQGDVRAWPSTRPGWEKSQTITSVQTLVLNIHFGLLHLQHVKQHSG